MAQGDKPVDVTSVVVVSKATELNKQTVGLRVGTGTSGKFWNITVVKDTSGVVESTFDVTKTYKVTFEEE